MSLIKDHFKILLKDHVSPFLKDHGFRKRGTDFVKSVGESFQHLALSLDEKSELEGKCYYFAFLEYPRVELLLNLGKTDVDSINTFGKQMGYLDERMRFEEWPFDTKTDLQEFGQKLNTHIEQHAFEFLEKYCQMGEAIKAMESGELFNLGLYDKDLRLAVMHFLSGNKHRSFEILNHQIEELSGKPRKIIPLRLKEYLEKNP